MTHHPNHYIYCLYDILWLFQCPCQVPTFGTWIPNIGQLPWALSTGCSSLRRDSKPGFDSPSLENHEGLYTTAIGASN